MLQKDNITVSTTGSHEISQKTLYKIAFVCSVIMLVVIPVQIGVFVAFPLPNAASEWFDLFNTAPIVGMIHADLLLLINNLLIAAIYLAFYHTLKDVNKHVMQLSLVLGFIGIAAYASSNKTFELWSVARQYASATDPAQKNAMLSAGQVMISGWQGTAFDVYYVLNGIALLLIALTMFKSKIYGKTTAVFALVAGILMTVPSTAGEIGLVFSLLSLIPWYVFTIMFCRIFWKMGR